MHFVPTMSLDTPSGLHSLLVLRLHLHSQLHIPSRHKSSIQCYHYRYKLHDSPLMAALGVAALVEGGHGFVGRANLDHHEEGTRMLALGAGYWEMAQGGIQ